MNLTADSSRYSNRSEKDPLPSDGRGHHSRRYPAAGKLPGNCVRSSLSPASANLAKRSYTRLRGQTCASGSMQQRSRSRIPRPAVGMRGCRGLHAVAARERSTRSCLYYQCILVYIYSLFVVVPLLNLLSGNSASPCLLLGSTVAALFIMLGSRVHILA